MDAEERQNRRAFIRFELHIPLFAELSLCSVGDRTMSSRSQKVLMKNISFGGCLFGTHLQLPARDDVVWFLNVPLGRHAMQLKTIIVRASEEDGLFYYGASWKMSAYESYLFQYRLNAYLQATYVFSPRIQSLYNKINERKVDHGFKKLDITL